MYISNIKLKSPKNTNIFLVTVGENEYIFHSDIIVKYGLSNGSDIDDIKFNEAYQESEYLICLNKSIEYMASRLKTTKQLKEYLYQKGYKKPVIDKVILKLKEYSVINDESYATAFIKSNQDKLSKRNILNKLAQKGINKDICNETIEEIDDYEVCKKMAEKFMKSRELDKKNIEKLIRHLQYKGFDWDSIGKVLKNYNIES